MPILYRGFFRKLEAPAQDLYPPEFFTLKTNKILAFILKKHVMKIFKK